MQNGPGGRETGKGRSRTDNWHSNVTWRVGQEFSWWKKGSTWLTQLYKHTFQRWVGVLEWWEGQWMIYTCRVQRDVGSLKNLRWAVKVIASGITFQTLMCTRITLWSCENANSALAGRSGTQDSAFSQAPKRCPCWEPTAIFWGAKLQNLESMVFFVFTNIKQSQKALYFLFLEKELRKKQLIEYGVCNMKLCQSSLVKCSWSAVLLLGPLHL